MLIRNKFSGYSRDGVRLYRFGGGGGSSQTVVSSSELPEWARPYAQETLGRAQAVSSQPYSYYGGPRIAGFSPLQLQAQQAARTLGPAEQIGTATGLAQRAGEQAFQAGQYTPGQFASTFQAPEAYAPGQFSFLQAQAPDLAQYQMAAPERVAGAQVGTPTMQAAQTGFRPDLQAFQIGAPAAMQTPEMQAAQTGYRPDLQMFQMAAPERVRTGTFTRPGTAEQYMSPYIEQTLTPQLREAQRASDILGAAQSAQAAKAGALGGGRAAIMQAERQRALATQMGDIRARGLQSAYEQAQQLYGTEQQRAMQAQMANQQAGLTAGGQNLAAALGVQQLGAQTGLQTALANLSSQQQANVQNQAAALQTQGLNAQQALQTALANQQAALGTQQLGTQAGLQTALANLSSEQQANVQNQAAALQSQGLNAQQALQAALANQQAGLTAGQTNLQALLGVQQLGAGQSLQAQLANQQAFQAAQQLGEQSRQFGAGQGLQAAGLGAQYGQAAQQLGEQSRQFGAGLGLQGLQTAQQSANILGQLGQQQFGQLQGAIGLQSQLGAQQQALRQQGLSQAYQDFLAEQNYPYRQLGFMSDLIRGLPLGQQSAQQVYTGAPSPIQTLGSLGMGMYGMRQLGMFAEGGSVTDDAFVESALDKMSDTQLAEAERAAVMRNDTKRINMIAEERATRASERSGLAGAFNQIPQADQERMVTAARGGILAFKKGGTDDSEEDEEETSVGDYGDAPGPLSEFPLRLAQMPLSRPRTTEEFIQAAKTRAKGLGELYGDSGLQPFTEALAKQEAGLAGQREEGKGLIALAAAQALSSTPGLRQGIGQMFGAIGTEAAKMNKDIRDSQRLIQQSKLHLAQAEQARNDRRMGVALDLEKQADADLRAAEAADRRANLTAAQILSRREEGAASRTAAERRSEREIAARIRAAEISAGREPAEVQIINNIAAGLQDKDPTLSKAAAQAQATQQYLSSRRDTETQNLADRLLQKALLEDPTIKDDPLKLATARAKASTEAFNLSRGFGLRSETAAGREDVDRMRVMQNDIRYIQAAARAGSDDPKIRQRGEQELEALRKEFTVGAPTRAGAPTPTPTPPVAPNKTIPTEQRRAAEEWLKNNPDHPKAAEIRALLKPFRADKEMGK